MKILLLQVIGKALVLDEIINYIQSLQRQVEVSLLILPYVVKYILWYFLFHLTLLYVNDLVFVDEAGSS